MSSKGVIRLSEATAKHVRCDCARALPYVGEPDPLGAAFLGMLYTGALEAFRGFVQHTSPDALCVYVCHGLHRAWPELGRSVRCWPKLAEELEQNRLIPRLLGDNVYRHEAHVSLFKVITDMHAAGESREHIVALLRRHGL